MPALLSSSLRRLAAVASTCALILLLAACGNLLAALPERPSPVPTLARLPSVTPITPSPTRPPTATPTVTPTPTPLRAQAARNANVRAGPGTDFAIVGALAIGDQVTILGRSDDWYELTGPDALTGWVAASLLTIDPVTADAVPTVTPAP